MLTTKQVRAIMRQYPISRYGVYTNKTKGHTGVNRRVKCYYGNNDALLNALIKAAGSNNVNLTAGYGYSANAGITVKCVLA
jgi:hypothetical protein